jgi:hypothetical protein
MNDAKKDEFFGRYGFRTDKAWFVLAAVYPQPMTTRARKYPIACYVLGPALQEATGDVRCLQGPSPNVSGP